MGSNKHSNRKNYSNGKRKEWQGDSIDEAILQSEIEVQKSRIQPHDTGHIHTTISVLEDRVEELVDQVKGVKSE